MSSTALAVIVTAAVWLAVLGVFVLAVRKRWFAHFRAGFFVSLLMAIMGASLMAASVVGAWGYEAARRILNDDLVLELQDVGRVVENEIGQDFRGIESGLQTFGASIAPLVQRTVPASELADRLNAVERFNPRFLEISLFDRDGHQLATSADARPEEVSRAAIGYGLDGKLYVSDAEPSKISGKQVIEIALPLRVGTGPVVGVIAARYDLQSELTALVGSARFNQSGYAVMVDGEGQIIAHHDERRLNENIGQYPAVQRARQTRGLGSIAALNSQGQPRVFAYRPITNPSTVKGQPWVLLTEVDADEQLAPLLKIREELLIGLAFVLLASLIAAHQVSWSIQRPLVALGEFARRVGSGDLSGHVAVAGRDVAGRLATALNEMTRGLSERDHVKEIFGRYIATQVSDEILNGQANLGGEARRVTILFSDIRNFTAMAEQMTPAQVVTFLNDYFSEMVDAVFEQNGMLDKFLGDGLMAVFGAFGESTDHPRRAVLAALRMKALLAKINGERAMNAQPPIAIGIGIHSDEVVVGNIGSRKRLEFTVVGDGVNVSSRLQTLNKELGTTILISETTFAAVKDDFVCREMPEAHLRGKTQELRFYEVVSVKAAVGV